MYQRWYQDISNCSNLANRITYQSKTAWLYIYNYNIEVLQNLLTIVYMLKGSECYIIAEQQYATDCVN